MNPHRYVAAVALTFATSGAMAQTCAGFNDVLASDPFCPNVEWLRNRAITTGCGAGNYCPSTNVKRNQMAAFMNRLGTALTPVTIYEDATPGGIAISTTGTPYCVTSASAVQGYPRTATVNGSFAATAAGDVTFRAVTVYSINNGPWTPTGTVFPQTTAPANQWSSSTSFGTVPLTVGQSYRFAVQAVSASGNATLSDSRCQLLVLLGNRNGASSPF